MMTKYKARSGRSTLTLVLIIALTLTLTPFLTSCKGTADPAPEPEPVPGGGSDTGSDTESVIGNIPEGSILLFMDDEGAAKLVKDMEEGRIPVACHAMYDEMGSRPEVEVTDPEMVTEMYNRLGHMIIGGESQESITDCYHYVYFTLQDGTNVGWHFEGTGLLCWGMQNYEVTQSGSLWSLVRSLQDGMMEDE